MRTANLKEWIGRTDDAAIPPRVVDRVAQKTSDCCTLCKRKVGGRLRAEIDHVIPLILGGQHRESNLQLLCNECHAGKTRLDVKLKARIARSRKRQLGIRKPSRLRGPVFPKSAPQRSASKPLNKQMF